MSIVLRPCDYCQVEYLADSRYLKRDQGKYCSRSCSSKHTHQLNKPEPNVICANCGIAFYKSESKKKGSSSGLYFCARDCKDHAQRIGGIEAIQPPHYGTTLQDYRELAFRNYPHECHKCGYNKYKDVLEVNHIDCDRSNNSVENLEILCPTCHTEYHFLTKTGSWSKKVTM